MEGWSGRSRFGCFDLSSSLRHQSIMPDFVISSMIRSVTVSSSCELFWALNFYKQADAEEKKALELKEINNGRLAMLAIATFAAKEYLFDAGLLRPQWAAFSGCLLFVLCADASLETLLC